MPSKPQSPEPLRRSSSSPDSSMDFSASQSNNDEVPPGARRRHPLPPPPKWTGSSESEGSVLSPWLRSQTSSPPRFYEASLGIIHGLPLGVSIMSRSQVYIPPLWIEFFCEADGVVFVEERKARSIRRHILAGAWTTDDYHTGELIQKYQRVPSFGPAPIIPTDPLVPESVDKVRAWIQECIDTHTTCNSSTSILPTRLLDLGPHHERREPNLIETEEVTEQIEYATLSHRWGGQQPLTTTKNSIHQHHCGIPYPTLPQTFQDAIRVTRAIGLRYLWIDSLCIIQDDDHDWQRESSRMASVYGNSYITISAIGARDGNAGFLALRDHLHLTYCSQDGEEFPITVREKIVHLHPGAEATQYMRPQFRYPLLKRAWCFQERLLSPRILQFLPTETIFECREICHCECGTYPEEDQSIKHFFEDSSKGIIPTEIRGLPPHVQQWFTLVEDYSRMEITYPRDILPALSGIASKLHNPSISGDYLAGLWRKRFAFFLCWARPDSWAHYKRPEIYTAPSWSWASVCGPIDYRHVRSENNEEEEPIVEVLDVSVELKGEDPMGEVSGGYVKLRGPCSTSHARKSEEYEAMWVLDIKGEVIFDIDGNVSVGDMVYLLNICVNQRDDSKGERTTSLILQYDGQKEFYTRIGLFCHHDYSADPWETKAFVIV